jgi:Fe-S-cluster containining protein
VETLTTPEIKILKKFETGICFSCQMCGDCCRGEDTGEVYLFEEDIKRLADHLNYKGRKDLKEFSLKYLRIVKDTFYWKAPGSELGKKYKYDSIGFKFTGGDDHCAFLSDNKCTTHEARPFQCSAFPIGWNLLVNNLNNFKEYSKKCPALKDSLENKGEHYPKEEILKWAEKEHELEKAFFLKMKRNNFDIFKVYKFLPKDITC